MNPKYLTILAFAVAGGSVLAALAYFNLYTFGGIDFPDESFGHAYWIFWWVVVYGGALVVVVAAILLVHWRDIGYPLLIGLLSLPMVAQVIAIVLHFELTARYGYVCQASDGSV